MEGNEVGTPLSRLALDPGSLTAVLEAAKSPNSKSSVRLNAVPTGAVEITTPLAHLCKKCRLTFTRLDSLASHGCGHTPGSVALLRVRPACKICIGGGGQTGDDSSSSPVFDTVAEWRRHIETVHSQPPPPLPRPLTPSTTCQTILHPPPPTEPPLSPRLSVEMEDVVNQITALAAQTLKPTDSNANLFDKFPVPSAGQ